MTQPLSTRNTKDPWRGGPLERRTPGEWKRDAALEYGEVKRDATLEYSERQGPLERGRRTWPLSTRNTKNAWRGEEGRGPGVLGTPRTPGEVKSDATPGYSGHQVPLER
ncbi:hypothetical protein NDU88_000536 [Pleurodeles waltl]|uniref:Uncharacterized protein n=1 Tax=Pleurodeles waltl TaxID=8319 RepID=A0AAV7U7T2_PLEWA|nr:hypothetical protein NDU88_000536 [Pleurodeles waltl]